MSEGWREWESRVFTVWSTYMGLKAIIYVPLLRFMGVFLSFSTARAPSGLIDALMMVLKMEGDSPDFSHGGAQSLAQCALTLNSVPPALLSLRIRLNRYRAVYLVRIIELLPRCLGFRFERRKMVIA